MTYVRDVQARCRCGHEKSVHVELEVPFDDDPKGAVKTKCLHGDCKCSMLDIVIRGKTRWA